MITLKIWTPQEIIFLQENYPIHGIRYCIDKLNKTRQSVRSKIDKLKLRKIVKKNEKYTYEYFFSIINSSTNYSEVVRKLDLKKCCGNRNTVKRYINLYNIDISHFDNGASNNSRTHNKKPISELLTLNKHSSIHNCNFKKRLILEGYKENRCEICSQDENWNGKKMSLILDHINGLHYDNRIENLRIVCPNCNATLPTHGGKNKNKYTAK